ncbi:hypothetical protein [Streptomyces sp. NPDC058254]|uniref:hypothetical protein n=1 Tax=Streptomyces sp. NPDC058254 TaxID=3346406 RepID=UPI0036E44A9F
MTALRAAIRTDGGPWTTDRAAQLLNAADLGTDQNSCWGLLLWLAEIDQFLKYDRAACHFTRRVAPRFEQAALFA